MAQDPELSPDEAAEAFGQFVSKEMRAGKTRIQITRKLVEMGYDRDTATQMVDEAWRAIATAGEVEAVTLHSMISATIGGTVAAIVGGALWALVVIFTGYELGLLAMLVGALAGVGVLVFSWGKRGLALQTMAAVASIAGILVGNYLIFFHFLARQAAEELGAQAAVWTTSYFSFFLAPMETHQWAIGLFSQNFHSAVDGFALLWAAIAVYAAWRIPQGIGVKVHQ